ncbi:transposase [Halococcus sp. IIIV-5B]|uniref:transposase n=1 Tax=Halococcus sp. IIIV-5B TaxID=2321230 RepID=UPI000E75CB6E|nr:transposase [Halococcus sp. IIIV-5B]RJT07433.1 transposase [Halococcus sp. IIIV-5B]
MLPTHLSRRKVFREIATTSCYQWPAYDSTPLYDRSSLGGLEEDVRTVARVWFEHDAHESVENFVCCLPLEYAEFEAHDHYTGKTRYGMEQLVRAFLLKELHGWEHESALVEYLDKCSSVRKHLGFESVPDQSTLWRTWHQRFEPALRETIQTAARSILIQADRADVPVPRQPPERSSRREQSNEVAPTQQEILARVEEITGQVSEIVHPAFGLDRGEGCEIHQNAFWELQTYLGMHENLAANEGARSFLYESNRQRTPLGHNHRAHLRELSIGEIREMYREAVKRVVDRLDETDVFHRAGLVAIDITEEDPFTGDREDYEDEIIGTKENTDEYAYQWATVQLVGNAVPLVLDARPVRRGETRQEIVEDLLDSAQSLLHIDGVLMDREFDSQHLLESVSQRGLTYVVPKRMYTSEKAQAKRLLRRGQDYYTADRKLHLGKNEWHETTFVYKRNPNSDRDDYGQYAVFLTNAPAGAVREYSYRWEIESGYKSIKRFMAATTSKSFGLRFFYFAFACLLYSIWRAVDLLVQVALTDGYGRSPIVTAQNTLTLLQKRTGIG